MCEVVLTEPDGCDAVRQVHAEKRQVRSSRCLPPLPLIICYFSPDQIIDEVFHSGTASQRSWST